MKHFFIKSKPALFIVYFLLFGFTSKAQLQELEPSNTKWTTLGQVKWLSNVKASLKYFVSRNDTTYLLYLQDEQKLKNSRDMTVSQYFSIRFNGADNTAGKLYDLMISFFTKENRQNKTFEKTFRLGNELIMVRHFPKLANAAISFSTTKNSIVFTEKELNNLFNK